MAASTSGVKPARSISRRQTRQLDLANEDEKVIDSELVPSSLNPIIPILRVANEIQSQNARVAYLLLYEVLKTVVPPERVDLKTEQYARDVEKKKEQYEHYNILPLYAVGVKPAIMELPEIKAALHELRKLDNLPMPRIGAPDDRAHHEPRNLDNHPMPRIHETHGVPDESTQKVKSINDILDWLSSIFGFQAKLVEAKIS
uniref:Uncharacterized protein n=1 Tax=Fagus sylvatica TaxID=28930 RepID=A0A2N9I5Q5_FAGSY